jgi:hypothetical protein
MPTRGERAARTEWLLLMLSAVTSSSAVAAAQPKAACVQALKQQAMYCRYMRTGGAHDPTQRY